MSRNLRDILTDLSIGDVSEGNYYKIEPDGTIVLVGDSTTWDDFSVALNRSMQGINQKPDYDSTNFGLLFPQNDTAEYVSYVAQMPHRKSMDSDIRLHVHYIQDSATQPTFKAEYRWYNNGEASDGSFTTISTADGSKGVYSYTSGSILQIASFPVISPPANETVSSNIDIKLYRDDNDVTGDVLTKFIDFHYEINMFGSREEFTK